MSIKTNLGKFGSRFAFEFFISTMHDTLIKGFRNYFKKIKPKDIPEMVRKGQFPPFEHLDFSAISDNAQHLEKISLLRFMEFIAEATPDLASAIQDTGPAGVKYMVDLRAHLLARIRPPAEGKEFTLQEGTVLAHCDKCDKKWPVKKEEVAAIKKCPFCGSGAGGEKEERVEEGE